MHTCSAMKFSYLLKQKKKRKETKRSILWIPENDWILLLSRIGPQAFSQNFYNAFVASQSLSLSMKELCGLLVCIYFCILCRLLREKEVGEGARFEVRVSISEVYNEQVRDLIAEEKVENLMIGTCHFTRLPCKRVFALM